MRAKLRFRGVIDDRGAKRSTHPFQQLEGLREASLTPPSDVRPPGARGLDQRASLHTLHPELPKRLRQGELNRGEERGVVGASLSDRS